MRSLLLHTCATVVAANLAGYDQVAADAAPKVAPCFDKSCIAPAQKSQLTNRPQLLPYKPLAATGAVVTASDGMARFTVLTDHLIRMEYAKVKGRFEDRASLAVLQRDLPVPKFTHAEAAGVLKISTAAVVLSYTVAKGAFTSSTLSVAPTAAEKASELGFPGWKYSDANPGNLLGTVRGQDGQSATDLNCTINVGTKDNGEYNHCEWGLVSRDGWVVYDDSRNAFTDENDWWSTTGTVMPQPAPPGPPGPPVSRNCSGAMVGMDANDATNDGSCSQEKDQGDCCAICVKSKTCKAYVFAPKGGQAGCNCWPLTGMSGTKKATDRVLGLVGDQNSKGGGPWEQQSGPQFSDVAIDNYGT